MRLLASFQSTIRGVLELNINEKHASHWTFYYRPTACSVTPGMINSLGTYHLEMRGVSIDSKPVPLWCFGTCLGGSKFLAMKNTGIGLHGITGNVKDQASYNPLI